MQIRFRFVKTFKFVFVIVLCCGGSFRFQNWWWKELGLIHLQVCNCVCVMLRCVVWCWAGLCCAVLCCVVLCCVVLFGAVLCCVFPSVWLFSFVCFRLPKLGADRANQQHNKTQRNTQPHNTTPHETTQHSTTVQGALVLSTFGLVIVLRCGALKLVIVLYCSGSSALSITNFGHGRNQREGTTREEPRNTTRHHSIQHSTTQYKPHLTLASLKVDMAQAFPSQTL